MLRLVEVRVAIGFKSLGSFFIPALGENYLLRVELGVQQCFGVVYHELTTLRLVYFARTAAK